jgi:hypothetical protein
MRGLVVFYMNSHMLQIILKLVVNCPITDLRMHMKELLEHYRSRCGINQLTLKFPPLITQRDTITRSLLATKSPHTHVGGP